MKRRKPSSHLKLFYKKYRKRVDFVFHVIFWLSFMLTAETWFSYMLSEVMGLEISITRFFFGVFVIIIYMAINGEFSDSGKEKK